MSAAQCMYESNNQKQIFKMVEGFINLTHIHIAIEIHFVK